MLITFSKWGLMAVRVTGMIGTGMVCTVGQNSGPSIFLLATELTI